MGTPPTVGGSDTGGINQAVTEYQTAYQAYTQDAGYMSTLLHAIEERKNLQGQKITTDQAYMMLIGAFGQMVQVTGDRAGVQSAAQGVGAACTNRVNSMVSDFNTLQDPASTTKEKEAAAKDLAEGIGTLNNVLTQNNDLPQGQQWIDKATVSNIQDALRSFSEMFGSSSPSANTIMSDVTSWSTTANSTTPDSGGMSRSAATQNLQTALGHLNTINSAFSSSTTIQGSLLQNMFAQVSTMGNAMRGLLQSLLSFNRTIAAALAPK